MTNNQQRKKDICSKCDHIRTKRQGDAPFFPNMLNNANVEVCLKEDVDAAIAELKAETYKIKSQFNPLYEELKRVKDENERLMKQRDELFTQGIQNAVYLVGEKLGHRATRRALWLARAERANARKDYWYARSCHEGDKRLWSIDGSPVKYIGCIKRTNFDWLKIWSEVECKCIKKAEEYK